jgi:hypothetical protein
VKNYMAELVKVRNTCVKLYDQLSDVAVSVEVAEQEIRKAEGHLLRAKELMDGEGIPGL